MTDISTSGNPNNSQECVQIDACGENVACVQKPRVEDVGPNKELLQTTEARQTNHHQQYRQHESAEDEQLVPPSVQRDTMADAVVCSSTTEKIYPGGYDDDDENTLLRHSGKNDKLNDGRRMCHRVVADIASCDSSQSAGAQSGGSAGNSEPPSLLRLIGGVVRGGDMDEDDVSTLAAGVMPLEGGGGHGPGRGGSGGTILRRLQRSPRSLKLFPKMATDDAVITQRGIAANSATAAAQHNWRYAFSKLFHLKRKSKERRRQSSPPTVTTTTTGGGSHTTGADTANDAANVFTNIPLNNNASLNISSGGNGTSGAICKAAAVASVIGGGVSCGSRYEMSSSAASMAAESKTKSLGKLFRSATAGGGGTRHQRSEMLHAMQQHAGGGGGAGGSLGRSVPAGAPAALYGGGGAERNKGWTGFINRFRHKVSHPEILDKVEDVLDARSLDGGRRTGSDIYGGAAAADTTRPPLSIFEPNAKKQTNANVLPSGGALGIN